MTSFLHLSLRWLALFAVASITAQAAAAEILPVVKPAIACEQLAKVSFSEQLGENVTVKMAETLQTAKGSFCKVTATIAPAISVEVALPAERWTQRFLQVGCGGLCGNVNLSLSNASGCLPAMNGEFAVAATDMGHGGGMMDASWAEDPQKRIDFAWRANHLTAQLTKALIQAYYHQPQKYAYFMGCSDGGREALMEAQRYPDDFDGITAGAPAAFFQFQNSFFHGWSIMANQRADGSAILLQDRLPILHAAVIKNCPTLSGVSDGVLENPYACRFSAKWVKLCSADVKNRSDCLTAEEIRVAEKLYRGATDDAGNQFVLGGLPLGSELRWPVPKTATGHSMAESMVLPALQSVLLPGDKKPIAAMKDFPLTLDNFKKVAELAPLYNASNTNLSRYQQRGGKLIMWHGLADDSVSPAFSLAYYRGVQKQLGNAVTDSFARLFLLPGVGHCGGGDGPDQLDLLTPLMAWTEQGKAPQQLIVGKAVHDPRGLPAAPPSAPTAGQEKSAEAQFHGVQRQSSPLGEAMPDFKATRPVYPYPYIARYTGKGAITDAASYRPVKSTAWDNLVVGKPASDFIGPDNQKNYSVRDGQLVTE
ncbi:tannase/feruloyl esterase family alpha/beta hydrolase [Erwinia sp. JUb26]|uniref:tannase/feruloyl esterase family alpha/beta hydrolase n=1 Tax=Erwinia sp. JUb26 TaxID=2485126 RepID=UPI000F4A6BFF|nr:feruloyl esterase [Erwinia sp. JUb26]